MSRFVEGVARTNRLYCSNCNNPIRKGEEVVFKISDSGEMIDVFCSNDKDKWMHEVYNDSVHPFSDEAF